MLGALHIIIIVDGVLVLLYLEMILSKGALAVSLILGPIVFTMSKLLE